MIKYTIIEGYFYGKKKTRINERREKEYIDVLLGEYDIKKLAYKLKDFLKKLGVIP